VTGERPDDAREPDGTAAPGDGADGLEARRTSDTDAPFHGLRRAADIFGAPRSADEWPSRRERREAEKAARETGEALPEPFEPGRAAAVDGTAPVLDDGATQAISMPEELAAPTENPQAAIEHERETLSDRIPAAAPVPPTSTAQHPSSITLPTAQTHRDQRAAENRAVDEERRRVDPFGQGRSDVDWLGRVTGSQPAPAPAPTGPIAQQAEAAAQLPLGVENVLPTADEPPSFTELLRLGDGGDDAATASASRPFDWAIRDDEAGEVPATLTSDSFDTTTLGNGSWSLAAEEDDDVVSGEVPTPGYGLPAAGAAAAALGVAGVGTAAAAEAHVAGGPSADAPAAPTGRGAPDAGDAPEVTGAATDGVEADATRRLQADAPTAALPVAAAPDATASLAAAPGEAAPDDAAPDEASPWWAGPDTTAAPPLVEPAADAAGHHPAQLPPTVGQDLDAVTGLRGPVDERATRDHDAPERLPATAPEDLDQSEWDGRETSDTSAIKDLFGTEAVGQLGGTGYDPQDTGTRMMPAATQQAAAPRSGSSGASASAPAPAAAAPAGDGGGDGRDNFINEGFARLRNEGRRGKLLLVWGSVALIVVLLVAVFALTKWILGNTIEEHTPAPTRTAAASAQPSTTPTASEEPAAAASAAPADQPALTFATTPASPGEHQWNELAGGECLSPFSNAWAQTYTVVDCAAAHLAQLTARLEVTSDQWPGAEALATQAASRCQASEALDTAAAAAYGDVQVQGSYAPDQATWDQGNRFLSCFVTRSSGQPLTGSLAPGA
jgi:hypothetical protein